MEYLPLHVDKLMALIAVHLWPQVMRLEVALLRVQNWQTTASGLSGTS